MAYGAFFGKIDFGEYGGCFSNHGDLYQQRSQLRQGFTCVVRGGLGQVLQRHATQLGNGLGNARQLGRCVATLGHTGRTLGRGGVEPVRRNVGGIRLQHQGVQRQGLRQMAQLVSALKRDRTAETQLEAQLDELLRLHRAAVERFLDLFRAVSLTPFPPVTALW